MSTSIIYYCLHTNYTILLSYHNIILSSILSHYIIVPGGLRGAWRRRLRPGAVAERKAAAVRLVLIVIMIIIMIMIVIMIIIVVVVVVVVAVV